MKKQVTAFFILALVILALPWPVIAILQEVAAGITGIIVGTITIGALLLVLIKLASLIHGAAAAIVQSQAQGPSTEDQPAPITCASGVCKQCANLKACRGAAPTILNNPTSFQEMEER